MQEQFKARVIEGGRITIPEVNRLSSKIKKGDIVSVQVEKGY